MARLPKGASARRLRRARARGIVIKNTPPPLINDFNDDINISDLAPLPPSATSSTPSTTTTTKSIMAGEATGGGQGLTLLGLWASPFMIRACIALNLKGLTYVYTEESLYDKSEILLKSNPVLKKVPVLIHDGKPIYESQIIVQYIDEAFPSVAGAGAPILPSDPYDRVVARFWASYVEDKLYSTWVPVFRGRMAEERVEAARQVFAVLETLEQAFEECSKGKAFFGGDSAGLVDVTLGDHLGWLYATEAICGVKVVDAAKTPLLVAWAERFCALDAIKELIPDVGRLVEYNKARRAGLGLPLLLPYVELQQ